MHGAPRTVRPRCYEIRIGSGWCLKGSARQRSPRGGFKFMPAYDVCAGTDYTRRTPRKLCHLLLVTGRCQLPLRASAIALFRFF